MPPNARDVTAWTLVQAGHVVGRRFYAAFGSLGLTPTQFGVLAELREHPGLSGAQLARRVLLTPQSISEVVASLVDMELLRRDPAAGRGRPIPMALTPAGEQRVAAAWELIGEVNGDAALGLTPQESGQLNEFLHRVIAAGGAPSTSGQPPA